MSDDHIRDVEWLPPVPHEPTHRERLEDAVRSALRDRDADRMRVAFGAWRTDTRRLVREAREAGVDVEKIAPDLAHLGPLGE